MAVNFASLICNPKNGSIFISCVHDFEGRARKSEILAGTEGFWLVVENLLVIVRCIYNLEKYGGVIFEYHYFFRQ